MGFPGKQQGRRHGERRGDHAADHDGEAKTLGLGEEGERFGETARLVELDVDRVVAATQLREAGAIVHAFVGADGDEMRDLGEA